ncbi:catalase [Pseudoalteromonas sp. McH1-42]|uniref:catalase n=1 Tax=Pseudoalteromonas sp. McH1-42 TaxID=2917752 RepID=UPI001EF4635D|nr:catalase [Pseudoalteromonas sp. McH1-42]MCG7561468.1 catalase [Pseudoalteromonas sp. McH1-42]
MSKKTLTNEVGAPIRQDSASITVGKEGPLTFDNIHLFQKLSHFSRERTPERVLHARGTGVFGTFKLDNDQSAITHAKFLNGTGKETKVFVRFSTIFGGIDSSDYERDLRGFAVKFYTEDGNYDLLMLSSPVFTVRDPLKLPDFAHSERKNPKTNLPSPQSKLEFVSKQPQTLSAFTFVNSDRGIPASYANMNGFSINAFVFYNKAGQRCFGKYKFQTQQGIKNLIGTEIASADPNGAQKKMVESIENGDFPKYTVMLQTMTEAQIEQFEQRFGYNPFDATTTWPEDVYPYERIGELTLNENVSNNFAENEQSAFNPANFVPGIGLSPDRVLQGRMFIYNLTQQHRVGTNVNQLDVNKPRCPAGFHDYQRDGNMALGDNQGSGPNFFPNGDPNAPQPAPSAQDPYIIAGSDVAVDNYDTINDDNYSEPRKLFLAMADDEQKRLAVNIADALKGANDDTITDAILTDLSNIDDKYLSLVQQALESDDIYRYLPQGSYRLTSQNATVELQCEASDADGVVREVSTSIEHLIGGLRYEHSQLLPEPADEPYDGFIPTGSYREHCTNIRLILTASCQKEDKSWQVSKLDITNLLYPSSIENIDGVLTIR